MQRGLFFLTFLLGLGLVCIELCSFVGISPSIGYIVAGTIINFFVLGDEYQSFFSLTNELAIGFLMFVIGMKISKKDFIDIKSYTSFSFYQVSITTILIFLVLKYFFWSIIPQITNDYLLILSGSLSLSSTALCVQLINEKKQNNEISSRATMAALLIQDLVAIIMLVGLEILVVLYSSNINSVASMLVSHGQSILIVLGIIFIVNPLVSRVLRVLSISNSSESIMIFCLFVVLGSSLVTREMKLSTELGPFLAGIILAGTKYKDQIINEIYNLSKVLLGLFFVSVGMSLDLNFMIQQWFLIFKLFVCISFVKGFVVFCLLFFKWKNFRESLKASALIAGFGEFTLVIIQSINKNMLPIDAQNTLISVTALSMLFTASVYGLMCYKSIGKDRVGKYEVIILGFTQKTQIMAEMLKNLQIPCLIIEKQHGRIQAANDLGLECVFGDGQNMKYMKSIVGENCKSLVLGFEADSSRIESIKKICSISQEIKIICFASDEKIAHSINISNAEVLVFSKTEQAIKMSIHLLEQLGWSSIDAREAAESYEFSSQEVKENLPV